MVGKSYCERIKLLPKDLNYESQIQNFMTYFRTLSWTAYAGCLNCNDSSGGVPSIFKKRKTKRKNRISKRIVTWGEMLYETFGNMPRCLQSMGENFRSLLNWSGSGCTTFEQVSDLETKSYEIFTVVRFCFVVNITLPTD